MEYLLLLPLGLRTQMPTTTFVRIHKRAVSLMTPVKNKLKPLEHVCSIICSMRSAQRNCQKYFHLLLSICFNVETCSIHGLQSLSTQQYITSRQLQFLCPFHLRLAVHKMLVFCCIFENKILNNYLKFRVFCLFFSVQNRRQSFTFHK